MAKVVAYALLTTAFIIFLTFSPEKYQHGDHHNHINRRLGNDFPLPDFDPIISKMERLKNKQISNTNDSSSQNEEDPQEFYGEDGKLNITFRLMILFPLVDKNPKDDFVSFGELESWNIGQALDRLTYRTQKEMIARDKDGDKLISFSEYLPQFSKEDIEKNTKGHGEAGWWMEKFVNADVDQNGLLNFDEFNSFLHPEDSDNEKIQIRNLKEKIKTIDRDDDDKLNIEEFTNGAYGIYKHYVDYEVSGAASPSAEEIFSRLDVNKDKFLDADELRPMYRYLYPGELTYARSYTNYLMQEADDNKDGKLSLQEMLNNEYIFYSTVYHDEDDDDDDDYDTSHDELR